MPQRYLFVAGTFCLSLLLYIDRVCISASVGPITTDLGLSETQMGWVMSSFALGYALCQTPAGLLADRFGPRRVLTAVVVFWSVFTGLTGAAFNLVSMIAARLLFGAGEAGAYPAIARATYSWIPMQERGLMQGINFSGSRIGGAVGLPLMTLLIDRLGWRQSFAALMVVGFVWAAFWYLWFRDDPAEHPAISDAEREHILANRQQARDQAKRPMSLVALATSGNLWLASAQYFASNFTFFFCLSWMLKYLKDTYELSANEAALYAAVPLLCGALGQWLGGWLVDRIYRLRGWKLSRSGPAILGFALAAGGMLGIITADSPKSTVFWLSLAVLGADMTIAPSWSFCIDIGREHAGAVSGTMNMAGNIGSFITALAFPYLHEWTGSHEPFFYVAAGLNAVAIAVWLATDPRREIAWGGRAG